ncbi:hypothetical protein ACFY9F_00285 [Streptomyces sp. NPDC012421]|uniref:hypothetical protein n=1 Tax=Streptomyces sp. NPDC012421 TaxID=3364832 RepID=UPI0036ED60BB
MRWAFKRVAVGMAVCLLASACGGGEEPEPERVMAEQQCDDTLSPAGARALETVLDTKRFSHDPRGGLERAVTGLVEDYPDSWMRTPGHTLCRASPPTGRDEVEIEFHLLRRDGDLPGDEHAADLHPYDMGVEALSGPRVAQLYVRCVSPRFEGSDERPALVMAELDFRRSKLPDTLPIREANLTLLHSATLAVVRKLGCEGDAGLAETPVFKALSE